jgi:hypothetical protein
MEAAFERLTAVQQKNVNKHMFAIAYNCVVRSKGNEDFLMQIICEETSKCSHLKPDLIRYCKLVQRVM